jgi:hypothetical protein
VNSNDKNFRSYNKHLSITAISLFNLPLWGFSGQIVHLGKELDEVLEYLEEAKS